MPITPDTKDWTWVLERVCPDCGFDVWSFPRERTGEVIRSNAARWEQLLDNPLVDRRPSDVVWSGLEYACHVRDVFRLYDERLRLMLTQNDPLYPNWDQNAAAAEGRYDEQIASAVASELTGAAARVADSFDAVDEAGWQRTGRRSDGVSFTVETFARYLVHDPVHHVHDVERGYAALGSTAR